MILLSVLVPLFGCAVTAAGCAALKQRARSGDAQGSNAFSVQFRKAARHILPGALLGMAVFLCCSLVIRIFTFSETGGLPLGVLLPVTAILFLPHIFAALRKDGKVWRIFRAAAVISLVLIAAEVFVFNLKCLTAAKTEHTFSPEEVRIEGTMIEDNGTYRITGIAAVNMDDLPEGTRAIVLKLHQDEEFDTRRFRMTLSMRDRNIRLDSSPVRIDYSIGYSGEHVFSFQPYEPLYSVRILFDEYSKPITLESIRALSAAPFSFSYLRFYLLLLICSGIAAIKISGFHRLKCSDRPALTELLFNIMTILCAVTMVMFRTPNSYPFEYDKNLSYPISDPYVQTAHALNNGRVYIDYPADPDLETLVNPYDLSERNATGVGYGWDLAYKDGHYYSYFGLAPVLTFYFPYYFLSGNMPALSYANMTFAFLGLIFLCLTLKALMRLMIPNANLLAFLCMMPVSVGAVGIYSVVNFPNNYNLPVASGMCYLFLCLWLGFTACDNRLTDKGRLTALFFSGLGLGLCAMSRPTMAIGAAILLPLFLGILCRKQEAPRFRIANAAVFAVPLFICVGVIFWYNKARFGSILDFGQEYQITVTDIHANKLELSYLPGAVFAYFLQMPRLRNTFPYFELEFYDFLNYGKRFYVAQGIGAFAYPTVLLGTLYLPYAIYHKRRGKAGELSALTDAPSAELPPENAAADIAETETAQSLPPEPVVSEAPEPVVPEVPETAVSEIPQQIVSEPAVPELPAPETADETAEPAIADHAAEPVVIRSEVTEPDADADTESEELRIARAFGAEPAAEAEPEPVAADAASPADGVSEAAAAKTDAQPAPKKKIRRRFSVVTALQRNAFIILCFVVSLIIAWQDFCLGGVIRRYQFDFMPILMIGCFITLLHMLHRDRNRLRSVLVFGSMAVTFAMFWLLEIELIDGNLNANFPNLYDTVAKLIQFWR